MDRQNSAEARRIIVPASHVLEDENEVVVRLEMPGVAKEGLDIKVEGTALTIEGARSDEVPRGRWILRERRRADYRKAFTIDESIDREGISAELSEGILTLRLRVREASKPKRISIA